MKKIFALVGGAVGMAGTSAMAAVDLTGVDMSAGLTTVETAAGIVVTGLVGLWGIRKLIKLFNRS